MIKHNSNSVVFKEIHKIRKEISKKTKTMTAEEEINYWHQMMEKGLKENGFRLIITPEGKKILRKTK
jgi:hypothetical protein